MTGRPLTATEIERYIDILDRSEPGEASAWRASLDALTTDLSRIREWRWRARYPSLVVGLIVAYLFRGDTLDLNDFYNAVGVAGLWVAAVDLVFEKTFVIISQEDRIKALMTYYGLPTNVANDPQRRPIVDWLSRCRLLPKASL